MSDWMIVVQVCVQGQMTLFENDIFNNYLLF